VRTRTRATALVVAFLLALLAIGVVVVTGDGGGEHVATRPDRSTTTATTAVPPPSSTGTTVLPPPTTRAPTTTTAAPSTTAAPAATPLRVGSRGPEVLGLEQQLNGLGYWLGTPDDWFDASTAHAVVAFQKQHGLVRDGIAGSQVFRALAVATPASPRSRVGHHVEIDLARQVLLVVDAAGAVAVLDVSTGRIAGTTPAGHFTVTREIDGYRHSPLGVLYRPKYFDAGVAVHGYPNVPPQPASHGCVRTTNAAMDWLWASGNMALGSPVWVYR
jgi:peptidoglycan hydrolase-like protein with peptidoglycan-binding domain